MRDGARKIVGPASATLLDLSVRTSTDAARLHFVVQLVDTVDVDLEHELQRALVGVLFLRRDHVPVERPLLRVAHRRSGNGHLFVAAHGLAVRDVDAGRN